jgi:hypothetical protein
MGVWNYILICARCLTPTTWRRMSSSPRYLLGTVITSMRGQTWSYNAHVRLRRDSCLCLWCIVHRQNLPKGRGWKQPVPVRVLSQSLWLAAVVVDLVLPSQKRQG